jgi:hypothetical protein
MLMVGIPITAVAPNISFADSPKLIKPISIERLDSVPIGLPIKQTDIQLLSTQKIKFRFNGAECTFKNLTGCTITKSSNSLLPIGLTIKAIAARTPQIKVSSAFSAVKCNWCSIAGDFIAITLFVAFAPASSPAVIIVATYSVGIGIILGNA